MASFSGGLVSSERRTERGKCANVKKKKSEVSDLHTKSLWRTCKVRVCAAERFQNNFGTF